MNCFEIRIGFVAFLLAVAVGSLLNLAYGELPPWPEELDQQASQGIKALDQYVDALKSNPEINTPEMQEFYDNLDNTTDTLVEMEK